MAATSSFRWRRARIAWFRADDPGADSSGNLFLGWVGLMWAMLLASQRHAPSHGAGMARVNALAAGWPCSALVMLILTFTPSPIRHSSLLEVIRQLRSGQ